MKRRWQQIGSASMMLAGTMAGDASEVPATALPGTAITSSRPSVIEGLTEIVAGENVLYVDVSGRYLVIGSIYDLIEDRDLSAERRTEVTASRAEDPDRAIAPVAELPLDDAVTTGQGARSLTVIMDPDCGWCRRLWAESLRDLEGVRVHHLLAEPSEQAIGISCAGDPPRALAQALEVAVTTRKTPVPDTDCRREALAKLRDVERFIERSGLAGTPVLIREDGAVHRGYLGRPALTAWLEGNDDEG